MLTWSDLHRRLGALSARHAQIVEKFDCFAKHVERQVAEPEFHIQGICTSLHLEQSYFTASFAGRTVRFQLSTPIGDSGTLKGRVVCYLVNSFPAESLVELSCFSFSGSGETDVRDPEENDPVNISVEIGALYLALLAIHESLQK
jgi:hypothetical protein